VELRDAPSAVRWAAADATALYIAKIGCELALGQIPSGGPGLGWRAWGPSIDPTDQQEIRMRRCLVVAAGVAAMAMAGGATAAEVEVKMLNKGTEGVMVFEPALVKVAPGDTVKFVSTDKGHNAETIKGMLPDGGTTFVGKMGEDVAVKFDQAGIYGIKCPPHYGMGMVAMVVVGTPANEEQARAVPQVGKAKQVFAALFDKLAATKTAAK
jgi:pseudoazurin